MKTLEIAKWVREKCNKLSPSERRFYFYVGTARIYRLNLPDGTNPMRSKKYRKLTARQRTKSAKRFKDTMRKGKAADAYFRSLRPGTQELLALAS